MYYLNKSCPLCKGWPMVSQQGRPIRWWWFVICEKCGCSTKLFKTKTGAVKRWNNRPYESWPKKNKRRSEKPDQETLERLSV